MTPTVLLLRHETPPVAVQASRFFGLERPSFLLFFSAHRFLYSPQHDELSFLFAM